MFKLQDEEVEITYKYQSSGLAGHVNLGSAIDIQFGTDRNIKFIVEDVDDDDNIYLRPVNENFNANFNRRNLTPSR